MENPIIIGGQKVRYKEHPLFDEVDVDVFLNTASLTEKSALGELLAALNDKSTWESAFIKHLRTGNSEIYFHSLGDVSLSVAIHNGVIYVIGVAICADDFEDESFRLTSQARFKEIDTI